MTLEKIAGWISYSLILAVLFITHAAYGFGTWQFWFVVVGLFFMRICDSLAD